MSYRNKVIALSSTLAIFLLIYAAGIASSVNAVKADSGTYIPDSNYCNARADAGRRRDLRRI